MFTNHLVQFSGGISSWRAARRVAETVPREDKIVLVFADTRMEDEDLYRFLDEAAANVVRAHANTELVRLCDGRTPWEVFRDARYLGNTRVDPCSRILKRELIDKWRHENFTPETSITYLGFTWDEMERWERAAPRWAPWPVRAPLCEKPFLPMGREAQDAACREQGIEPPRLYALGFAHNNCGGMCVKAGIGHFLLLLEKLPERYAQHEEEEEALRAHLGKDVAILRDRRGGQVKPLTLRQLRLRTFNGDAGLETERTDIGGCSCFLPEDAFARIPGALDFL